MMEYFITANKDNKDWLVLYKKGSPPAIRVYGKFPFKELRHTVKAKLLEMYLESLLEKYNALPIFKRLFSKKPTKKYMIENLIEDPGVMD